MNRMDDLISKLSEIRSEYNCFNQDEEPYYRALSEVISILSRRADGDTISRQAAIANAISGRTREIDDEKWIRVSEVRESIKTLPSAERLKKQSSECKYWDNESNFCSLHRPSAERRGRWVIRDDPRTEWYEITCSECGENVTSTAPCIGFFPVAKVTWDYCPICGSFNGEGGENEELQR